MAIRHTLHVVFCIELVEHKDIKTFARKDKKV